MIIHKSYEIASCDDVELNIKRESKLEFKLTYDDSKQIRALVCIIPGMGAHIRDNLYIDEYCARTYDVAALSVNYHCIGNRPQTGSSFFLDHIDKLILDASLRALKLSLPLDPYSINCYEQLNESMKYINEQLYRMKKQGRLAPNYFLNLHTSLQPSKNEYQNFGLMQAMDIINAILYTRANLPKLMGGGIFLVGASHGGYLANLCAKIAPWNVDALIDNSSYTNVNKFFRIVGFGKEIDFMRYAEFSSFDFFQNINMHCSTRTYWTSNAFSIYHFSNSRKMIRDVQNKDHLRIQSLYPRAKYVAYHSKFDQYVSLEEREEYFSMLKQLGFDVDFIKITQREQVDGKFIKNLEHGMGIPMKLLIKRHLDDFLQAPLRDKSCKKEISYTCDDLVYSFKEQDDQIRLEIKNL